MSSYEKKISAAVPLGSKADTKSLDDSQENIENNFRARNWLFLGYPDSLVENWEDILNEMAVPFARSPLHDSDIDGNGEPKKPHWHFIITFYGKKSYKQVKEIATLLGCPRPKVAGCLRAATRYFLHLDHKDKKHDYSDRKNEIVSGGGFDVAKHLEKSQGEIESILNQLEQLIFEKKITEYAYLSYWVHQYKEDWLPTLRKNSYQLRGIISSLRHNQGKVIDMETGESI